MTPQENNVREQANDLVSDLESRARAREEAEKRVSEAGERRLQRLHEHYTDLMALFDRYEERATGDGDFKVFIEFQEEIATFVAELPEDLDHRDRFEEVDDILHQRRLTESDFQKARNRLEPVADLVERLDERERLGRRYEQARHDVAVRKRDLEERTEELQRLVSLGEADLDAPVEHLADPIETYNDAISETFETRKREDSAREMLAFVEMTSAYPLVPYRVPPEDLATYVTNSEAGTEPITTLLEYAEYSVSKLDHYVPDARQLKRNVATHQTYLRRLDSTPLEIAWPPPSAETLWWRCRELIAVVGRIAPEETVELLRTVRHLPRTREYDRLRESARARSELTDDERARLERGEVQAELEAVREARTTLENALNVHPPL